ncbi:DsrE/DsrF/DrsH-like family protein [uncultured Clostridium sp.]|uniref:DsrE/DsrF/DrsH-like family protein n=1 Tax=uncultured Clostridium sp. TaxID=59620 RepID=UPI002628C0D3|nr:DsrE/DsrF/DrsH-like family protein [uncultured Clostridium sp.]
MSKEKVLIIGGVATGASAAARLRRLNEDLEIVVFEKGDYISFANCGLPYHIGEVIKDREKLILQTPEKFNSRFRVDVRVNSEVVEINPDEKKVKVNKNGEIYEESYDYLVLAPGAKPMNPMIKGNDSKRIHMLRNIKDMDGIKSEVDNGNVQNAIVIGGGFIGIEVAENLGHRGINVNLVEAAPHILAPFDSEMSELLEMEMNENDISITLNDRVIEFIEEADCIKVKLNSGKIIKGDIVVSAIGVVPDTELLKGTGINLGDRGHILVDEFMRTNKDGIYAGGDAVAVKDVVNGETTFIPLAGPANKQGRIIADNIVGRESTYNGSLGTSIIKVFNLTAAATGNNERMLKNKGIEYKKVYLYPNSHAGYYPGSTGLSIKVLYGKENNKVLGAQCVGFDGVDKFIDVVSTVIMLKGTMEDLSRLELAYAPPYLSAKSPANMAGFIADNEESGLSNLVYVEDLKNRDKENSILVDLRENIEVEGGMIDGAIHIPVDSLRSRLNELDRGKEIWVYCAVGVRGWIGERILKNNGFNVKNLSGGYKAYKTFGYKAEEIEFVEKKTCKIKCDENPVKEGKVKEVDLQGLCCPGPLMEVNKHMSELEGGDILKASASDVGFFKDVQAWAKKTGNTVLDVKKERGIVNATILKGGEKKLENSEVAVAREEKNGQTMVVFSGELDKAIAAFIIANGAKAMGKDVTMFFTFWGLNILRKHEKVSVSKNPIEKMFGAMMPRGSKKLGLSKMNMGGMGSKMIRGIMKKKNVQSLEELIEIAIASGIKIVACTMSMDVMGIKEEELIDGIEYGGVGYYLGEAEESTSNLFI